MPETNARIKVCHDTATNFKTNNPTLLVGEWALETDTKKMKIGDGTTAYNLLPYSTAEDTDWVKPADWVDIRSGALPNSVYFLVAHSTDYTTYPKWAVTATITNSGTYDVFIDGVKQATTASGTATVLDWQTLALTSGYDVIHPVPLRTHVIRVTPSSSANEISAISNSSISEQLEQGILWAHFTTVFPVRIGSFAGTGGGNVKKNLLLEAITAQNDELNIDSSYSGAIRGAFYSASSLVKVPTFVGVPSSTTLLAPYRAFGGTGIKKLKIKDIHVRLQVLDSSNIEELETNVPLVADTGTGSDDGVTNIYRLKKIPPLTTAGGTLHSLYMSNFISLEPTFVDLSQADDKKTVFLRGSSATNFCAGLKGLVVSSLAPFDGTDSRQIDVRNTGLDKAALVNLFKSMPYNIGYTVEGSPTITNGVVSGFSSSNYLDITDGFAWDFDKDFEFQVDFTPTSTSNAPLLVGNSAYYGGLQVIDGKIRFACRKSDASGGVNYSLASTDSVVANSSYVANAKRVGNTLTLTIYKDGSLLETKTDDLTNVGFIQNQIWHLRIGYTAVTGSASGSVNLNNTYIKKNGVPWFRGTAAMTKTISVVGCTGTADLTAEDKAIAEDKGWAITLS